MNPARDRLKLSGIVIWTGERGRQQARLVAGMYRAAAGVPCERSAVIAGGLPGADKAAALDRSGVDRSRYLTVSIGAVLDEMAGAGLIPGTDGLSPLTRAGQVHAEAQHLAKRVLLRALIDGTNVILDISLASWRAAVGGYSPAARRRSGGAGWPSSPPHPRCGVRSPPWCGRRPSAGCRTPTARSWLSRRRGCPVSDRPRFRWSCPG